MKGFEGQTIWIIGASSGIGAALARQLAHDHTRIILTARRQDDLERLAATLLGHPIVLPLDIREPSAVRQAFTGLVAMAGKIDRVILMAGHYEPQSLDSLNMESVRQTLAVNLAAAFTVIDLVIPFFKQQGLGQLALCGSVAGYFGLPQGQPYSATKAALINLAESLRAEMADTNVDIRLISPGFVKTPMTAKNTFFMPLIISSEQAASAIAHGLTGRAFEIRFPKLLILIMIIIRHLPYRIYFLLMRRLR